MGIYLLVTLVIITAVIFISAAYRGPKWQVYLFKPLATLLILLIAVLGEGESDNYKLLILFGLLFSLLGDVLLMLPEDRFLAGVGAFLLAHSIYILAFLSGIRSLSGWLLLPFSLSALGMYAYLGPKLGRRRFPVILYMMVILVMGWLAWERWLDLRRTGPFLAGIGAVLFIISDALWGIDRFQKAIPALHALSLATYVAAQLLIAGSTGALLL